LYELILVQTTPARSAWRQCEGGYGESPPLPPGGEDDADADAEEEAEEEEEEEEEEEAKEEAEEDVEEEDDGDADVEE
jgi:hypothetical protein